MTNCACNQNTKAQHNFNKLNEKHDRKIEHYNKKHGTNHVTLEHMKKGTYCPHMEMTDGEYQQTTSEHTIDVHGAQFNLRTCCKACADAIQENLRKHGLASPYICFLGLCHRQTDELVQLVPKKKIN